MEKAQGRCEISVRKAIAATTSLVLVLATILLMAMPVMAADITGITVIPTDNTTGATADYSITFTSPNAGAANVTIDFSAFGNTATDMDLTAVSTNISNYSFTGFSVNATGVSINTTAQTITFTGGNVTAGAHTISNAVAGTGLRITNDQDAETQNVTISTTLGDSGTFALTIDPGAIDNYSVSAIGSPQVAGVSFNVTIQARDSYNNNIITGADASENITISFGKVDASATPTSTTTANGTATVSMTMTVAQSNQSIIFTGATSNKTGTSNNFDVNPTAIDNYSVSAIGSPQAAGISFNVTIQAWDVYNNNITTGADSAETVNITFGKADAGSTPTSNTTSGGTATMSMTMTVAQSSQNITFTGTTSNKTGASNNFDVNPGAIDHYSVSAIASPQTAGGSFNVTIQAQDAYSNNITTGADASENITISFGKVDASATPTSTTTANGTATVSMTMMVAQSNQSIIFTGATSNKTGTSNNFDVNPAAKTTTPSGGGLYRPGENDISSSINRNGIVTRTITANSFDNACQLTLEKGITAHTRKGTPLYYITMVEIHKLPPPCQDSTFIGLVYDFRPDGATFDPPAILSIDYDPSDLPEGVSEENLVIAYWDDEAGECVKLDSTVDMETNTITAKVSHFTAFTILAYTRPAAFTVSDLTVSPAELGIGESVAISSLLTNTGDLTGSYQVTLNINNVVADTKDVNLAGGTSQTVTFTTEKNVAGSYSVKVDGLSATFTVKPPPVTAPTPAPKPEPKLAPAPTPEPAPAPKPAPVPAPVPEQAPAPTLPSPTPSAAVNWWLVGGIIIAGCIIIGLIIWLIIRRLRAHEA